MKKFSKADRLAKDIVHAYVRMKCAEAVVRKARRDIASLVTDGRMLSKREHRETEKRIAERERDGEDVGDES